MARPTERSYARQAVRGVLLLVALAALFAIGGAVIATVFSLTAG